MESHLFLHLFIILQATLRGEVQGTEGVLHDAGPCGHPRADPVAGIFHGQDVHLKAIPQLTAETVAAAKVLRVASTEWMGWNPQDPCMVYMLTFGVYWW